MQPSDFYGKAPALTQDDIRRAATALGCDPGVVAAVIAVEAAGSGYLSDGRPKILYEAHIFGRLTNNRYASVVDSKGKRISAERWDRDLYGAAGAWQYERLLTAMKYDASSALRACSWGAFQILGSNHGICGYSTVQGFVEANVRSSGEQLDCFVRFVKERKLDDELRSRQWAEFARVYNGPEYKKNAYDTKLASAYARLAGSWASQYVGRQTVVLQVHAAASPGEDWQPLRADYAAAQAALNALAIVVPALAVDGWTGPKTSAALYKYQELVGLPASGTLTRSTYTRLVLGA